MQIFYTAAFADRTFVDYLYGICIGLGMVSGIILGYFILKKRGYNPDITLDISIFGLPAAIIGARLYYVIFSVFEGSSTLGSWFTDLRILGFERLNGRLTFVGFEGLAVYGGIIAGALAVAFIVRPINRRKKNPLDRMTVMQMFDLLCILVILGQAMGRWGNYFNDEAYGNVVKNAKWQWFPIAYESVKAGAWVQATFFYESFFNMIGFGLLLWFYYGRRKSFDGFNFACYCIWYGAVRAIVESFRSDSLRLWTNGPRVSQWLSIGLALYGICSVLYHVYQAKKNGKKPFIFVDKAQLDESYYVYEKTIIYLHKIHDKGDNADGDGGNPPSLPNKPPSAPDNTEIPAPQKGSGFSFSDE